ncbi:ewing's tumor-associated antigen 1 [Mastacembelus armatus]|uniref:ETAA1 activator of ATR kinase n=1 Tax=Mastacembelus armatus TaxID=205130 RepID=A0A3Q3MYS9_9TELE|nr:ewing's tumor-associated antigen 1 [Mastacembelus armatus]
MSEPRTHAASAAGAGVSAEFTELWRNVSKLCHSKAQDKKTAQQMPGTAASPTPRDLQSPKHRGCSRYLGVNNADSPGDVEASHEIFWDPTSPTNTGSGLRNTRVVEISDIVDRIAPKDVKPPGTESPLLQWIGDSAVLCTPEFSKPRVRKKSSRQSNVEDLIKLARQFDEHMQQDKETSEQLNAVNNNHNECAKISNTNLTQTSLHSSTKNLNCSSSLNRVESELHALFDCSTQKVSGQLSQGSSASASSQEIKHQPVTSTLAEPRQPEPKSATSAAHPAKEKGSSSCDVFDDDWENDDLFNDSFVLAMTHNPDQQYDHNSKRTMQSNTKTSTTQFTSVCKPTTNSAHQPSNLHSRPSCSKLQELCPKPKTTNRSTFKLEPNPHFQAKTAAKEVSTVIKRKSQMSDEKSATRRTLSTSQSDKVTNEACVASDSVKDISDSIWDDGDDALLYQVCDSVERISNSQPQPVRPSNSQGKQDPAVDRQRKTTEPLPISMAWSMNSSANDNKKPPCAFLRSNSLPGTSCETVNYQGWKVPMKGANNKSQMSQSLPGSEVNLVTLRQCRDSSGTFQDGNLKVDTKPHAVTMRVPQNFKPHHTGFKRNVSDPAAISNKVFVTSQMTGKCSAAEIERKKQEALARRRLRMQNVPKP